MMAGLAQAESGDDGCREETWEKIQVVNSKLVLGGY